MRPRLGLVTLLLVLAVTHSAECSSNTLCIHLVSARLFHAWPTNELSELKLLPTPVVKDSDFVAFDLTNHTFAITGQAAKRLAAKIWELGSEDSSVWKKINGPWVHKGGEYELIPVPAPFVMLAGGQRIFSGAFYTPISSSSFSGPVIMPRSMFIKTNVPDGSTIGFTISGGYPGAYGHPPDPCRDPRLIRAVQTLLGK